MGVYKTHIEPFLLKPVNFNVLLRHSKQTGFSMQLNTTSTSTIKWDDGAQETIQGSSGAIYAHDYALPGIYEVEVTDALMEVSSININSNQVHFADFRRLNGVQNLVQFFNNPLDGGVIFGSSTRAINRFWGYDSPGLEGLDCSGLSGFGGDVRMHNCPRLRTWILPPACNSVGLFQANGSGLERLDMSGIPDVFGNFHLYQCPDLSELVFAQLYSGTRFWTYQCRLNQHFPLGSVIRCTAIRLDANGMSEANVNSTINSLHTNRHLISGTVNLNIGNGNAKPTGAALTQIAALRAGGDTITHS